MPASPAPSRAVYAGVFTISAATLLLQVTLIRIFSVAIWYHFAFLVVSVALFGIGASGVAASFLKPGARDARYRALASLVFSVSTLLAYVGVNAIPFSPFLIVQDPKQIAFFLLYDLLLMIPFFFAGLSVVLILRSYPARAGRLYALDLAGAAAGVLALFAVLPLVGARGAVAMAAALGAISATCLAPSRRLRVVTGGATLVTGVFVLWPGLLPDVRMDDTKPVTSEIRHGGARTFAQWSALARIEVIEHPHQPPLIFIDGAAATPVAPPRDRATACSDVSTLACQLRPGASVAVIGTGGGIDVQNSLALEARSVTAIEINPTILDVVRKKYRRQTGSALDDARVRIVRDEGRSYVARSAERFDVIQLTLIDTWAASVSGAYSLSENYLYTVEAFRSYLEHAAPDGMLSITRWYYELPRLNALARAALDEIGVEGPSRHVLLIEDGVRGLLLVKRSPFTSAEVDVARARAAASRSKILHDPVRPSPSDFYHAYLSSLDVDSFHRQASFAMHPVRDESPFFFQMAKWSNVGWKELRRFGKGGFLEPLAVPVAQIVLVSALVLGVLLSIGLLSVPLAARTMPRARRWTWLGYFFALGLAYIIVEVVLMQRFALFLGHPTYSVTAILFAVLLFTGLGAAWSDRRSGSVSDVLRPVRRGLPVAILVLTFAVPPLLEALPSLPPAARMSVAILLVGPVAFLMGAPFPTGIRAIGATESRHVAWAWAANGCASVVGSVCAVLGAMVWSFSVMLLVAMVVYVLALRTLSRIRVELP
jgi:spermidine synthase